MNFKDMDIETSIQKALDVLGYKKPTLVQEEVIPFIKNRQDIIVKSETGSGKTAAYAIPILHNMVWEENKPQCLVLVPTRELALQVTEDFMHLGVYKRVKALAIFGKQPYKFQIQDLRQKTHIVVGTPGRVLDHIQRGTLDISNIQYIVLDEADEMLHMGFLPTVETILSHIQYPHCTCMFSATMPHVIQDLACTYIPHAKMVQIQKDRVLPTRIEHYIYCVKEHEKKDMLMKLLLFENPTSAILFAKTQENVDDVCSYLYDLGLCIDKLHGGMLQEDRIENIKDFKKGKLRFLVATDVAARGLDITDVTHVINYDFPMEVESYIHRIGRTARMDKNGKAISFVSQYDYEKKKKVEENIGYSLMKRDNQELHHLIIDDTSLQPLQTTFHEKIDKREAIKKDIVMLYLNGGKKKKIRPGDIVGAICEIDGICAEDIGTIQVQDHHSYVQILNDKGYKVLEILQKKKIKGKQLKVEIAENFI